MCLTLTNANAIIDHHPSLRPAVRGYTRTWHHVSQLTPGDLWRPDPDRDPHTVTEVHHHRNMTGARTIGSQWSTSTPTPTPTASTSSSRPRYSRPADRPPDREGDHPMIAITHAPTDGTVLEGSSRGDGTNHLLKPLTWRWSSKIGASDSMPARF